MPRGESGFSLCPVVMRHQWDDRGHNGKAFSPSEQGDAQWGAGACSAAQRIGLMSVSWFSYRTIDVQYQNVIWKVNPLRKTG